MECPIMFEDSQQQKMLELVVRLCEIPAPSNHEEKRAEFCKEYLKGAGANKVIVDSAMNVIMPYNANEGDLVVVVAHMDTVFPDMEPMSMRLEDGRLYCPGAGDDTASLAQLLMIAEEFIQHKPETKCGILFCAVAGEEGYGNLKGTKAIIQNYGHRIKEFISFDHGSFNSIITKAVGSHRYGLEIRTKGGHSYGSFGNPNAIHILAQIIDELYRIEVPKGEGTKTTYNVGLINGGTSVNTIAEYAQMAYEYRSDSMEFLEIMREKFWDVINSFKTKDSDIKITLLGERPCSGQVYGKRQEDLVHRIKKAYEECIGYAPMEVSGSTDSNIPLSIGIPSATIGTYIGGSSHTREEYLEISSLRAGYEIIKKILHDYFK